MTDTERAQELRTQILALHEKARTQQPAKAIRTRSEAARLGGQLLELNTKLNAAGLERVL